ncbi:recombinase B [Mycobacteroides abscessus subsp. abscessus]|uniref:AAA family ATPase n=1 Tax=Mycobacteroides abscessus TaxID=36809 RepID=UPI000927F06F|nr:AAA family ATPase [Mycobacteroides abscessus]SIJ06064.1 recombinase B [Mycobacteroides abscessus subsp. abscessus]SIN16417.1 recombinase B [Mycobacteroides abscessus subsp. abscessus]
MRSRPTDFQPPAGVTPDVRVAADSAGQSVPIPAAATRWPGYDLLDSPKLARILLAAWSGDAATLVPACPGAGKSRLVALASAALAHRAGLRVAVAAQTREQARELAVRITALSDKSALIVSGNRARAAVTGSAAAQTVSVNRVRWSRPCGGGILIGTTARWLYVDPDLAAADVLVVDEAWQATYADMGALGALARQVVAVGDPGQIAPVVTGSTARWSGQATGPHQSAPAALLAAHGDAMTVFELTDSWRLGPATCSLVSEHFYPHMPFTSQRPDEAVITPNGRALPEISRIAVAVRYGPTDPGLLSAVADRVRELTWHTYRRGSVAAAGDVLAGTDIAVVVPHVAQAGALRALLADVPGVLIGTVNALQGLERPAVVAVHPMAGYRHPEPFCLDRGRMCVTLTRHRAHLSIVCDRATEGVLAATTDPNAAAALAVLKAL